LGEKFIVERIGTNGDINRASALIASLDGKVDAFGLGGIDRYLVAGGKRFEIRDAARLARIAVRTPVVDGSGLKNTLERRVVNFLEKGLGMRLRDKQVLMVSGVDRFGMAEAFEQSGARMVFGDLIFALGIPVPITSLKALQRLAHLALPLLTQMPFTFIYPTGSKQESNTVHQKYTRHYETAEIIAGDFLYIKKYMPESMVGKVIVTNTVTQTDLDEIGKRGAALLVTSTPELQGRSFGTNVMEALLVAVSGKDPAVLGERDYLDLLDQLNFEPRVVAF
jgi:hypothetical protein